MKIDWHAQKTDIFLNPRMPVLEQKKLYAMLEQYNLSEHILVATSGSTAINSSDIKWVALKKTAFLLAAQSVNKHLNCTNNDIFLNILPTFHVGALALFARAYCCDAQIINNYSPPYKWCAENFIAQLSCTKATISSCVPTQLFDILSKKLPAPTSLRALVVGGGFLSYALAMQAQQLNWPILPSYGMTECCSQIATAANNFSWYHSNSASYPALTILEHVNLQINSEQRIEIQTDALLTGYIVHTADGIKFIDPKIDNKIITNDCGIIQNSKLIVYGRIDENIKINGENVSLIRLQDILESLVEKQYDCAITARADTRSSHKIIAIFHDKHQQSLKKIEEKIVAFNKAVLPFERISAIEFRKSIPRTALGKLQRQLL